MTKLIEFIQSLMDKGFTGRIIIDFYKGSFSKKIKKEIVEIVE